VRILAVAWLAALATAPLAAIGAGGQPGRAVYESVCRGCHAAENVMVSSPKAGDTTEWARRLQKSRDLLIRNAIEGFNAMPPKGGCSECTLEEIGVAIDFMASYPAAPAPEKTPD
jgi:cytochrome c5